MQIPGVQALTLDPKVIVTCSEEWIKAEADKLVSVEPSKDIRNRVMGKDGQSRHYPGLLTLSGGFIEINGLHFVGVRDRRPHNLYSENGVTLNAWVENPPYRGGSLSPPRRSSPSLGRLALSSGRYD